MKEMVGYILRRAAYTIPIAMGASLLCFALVFLAPGDPLQSVLPDDANPETVAMIRRLYGFDQPWPVQYLKWLWRAVAGDLGNSIALGRPVLDEVLRALANTSYLAAGACIVSFPLGILLGCLAGRFSGGLADRALTAVSVVGISAPNFWLAIVATIVFSVELMWLPPTGMGPSGSAGFTFYQWEHFKYLILPVVTMSLFPLGVVMRFSRSNVIELYQQDFVQTLRSNGLAEAQVLRHVLKNAMPSTLTVMGLQFGHLLTGSILVETVFNWPGLGLLLAKAIATRDVPLVQGSVLIMSLIFVFVNLSVDLLQTATDPRMRRH